MQCGPPAERHAKILVEGIARARVTRYATSSGTLRATITPEPFIDRPESNDPSALGRRVLSLFEEYVSLHRRMPAEVVTLGSGDRVEERRRAPCPPISRFDMTSGRRCSRHRRSMPCSRSSRS
jgi:ATP-dependent Lon protease